VRQFSPNCAALSSSPTTPLTGKRLRSFADMHGLHKAFEARFEPLVFDGQTAQQTMVSHL
jgi:hypothetical protein